jgi:predicted RNase H-like HicB family nuclease
MQYPVVIHKDPDGDYGVTVPDLPGCFSAGSTFEEALANAVEAIELHTESLLLDGETIPAPRQIEAHRANPDYQDGTWALVHVNPAGLALKSREITLALPEEVIARVDSLASRTGGTRDAILANAALEYLAERQPA